ncbi:MAG: hypothetical protein HQK89_14115 [Nitrospirae bacterium]|nr:hypothetical protein [Nitrospirota bacterium]
MGSLEEQLVKDIKFICDETNVVCKHVKGRSYTPTRLIPMILNHGVVEAVKRCIRSKDTPDGYVILFELGRLDLSIECLVLNKPEYLTLFSEEDRVFARERLGNFKCPSTKEAT